MKLPSPSQGGSSGSAGAGPTRHVGSGGAESSLHFGRLTIWGDELNFFAEKDVSCPCKQNESHKEITMRLLRRASVSLRSCLFLVFVLGASTHWEMATAQDIVVSSATPADAPQGTVNLDVTISGKGFKNGATSQFFLTGTTNPAGITVHSTRYVSPTQLVANIDVATAQHWKIRHSSAHEQPYRHGIERFSVLSKARVRPTAPYSRQIRCSSTRKY